MIEIKTEKTYCLFYPKDPNCSPLKTTIRGRPFWPPLPYRDDIVYERPLIRNCEKIGRFRIQNWLLKCNEQDAEFSCFDDFFLFSFFFCEISTLFHGFLMISDWQLWWAEFQLFIQSNWPNWLWKTRVRNHWIFEFQLPHSNLSK